ncbi:hypothetical protein B7463_g1020, partial [Scytalidium lignicola]
MLVSTLVFKAIALSFLAVTPAAAVDWPGDHRVECNEGDYVSKSSFDEAFKALYDLCWERGGTKLRDNLRFMRSSRNGAIATDVFMCNYHPNPCRVEELNDAIEQIKATCTSTLNYKGEELMQTGWFWAGNAWSKSYGYSTSDFITPCGKDFEDSN